MNIIYINTHDSGRILSPYGYDVPTDSLKAFAGDAVTFTNAYCAAPTCSPSRAALLTGTYPHQNGMLGLAQRGFGINDHEKHMANFLKNHGYKTVLCGIQHEIGWYLDRGDVASLGYSENLTCDSSSYKKEELSNWDLENANKVKEWIENYDGIQPFFMSYGMHATHRPYPVEVDEGIDERFVRPPAPIVNTSDTRHDHAQYLTSAAGMDNCFSIVINALKEKGIYEDTIIIFTTDHGVALPFHKCNLTDRGIGVSFIMRLPGCKENGSVTSSLISQIDMFPTLCEILGFEKPDYLEGKSFAAIFNDVSSQVRKEVIAEINFHTSYEPARCIRTERYKLIKFFDLDYLEVNKSNIDNSLPKNYYLENGLNNLQKDAEALYDLAFDPEEMNNLINHPRYKDIATELRQKLADFQRETADPLLDGEIKRNSLWKINRRECVNPSSIDPKDYEY